MINKEQDEIYRFRFDNEINVLQSKFEYYTIMHIIYLNRIKYKHTTEIYKDINIYKQICNYKYVLIAYDVKQLRQRSVLA